MAENQAFNDFIPRTLFHTFPSRNQPRPIVAWHALESEPSLFPLLVLFGLALCTILIYRNLRDMPLVASRHLRLWVKDPFGHHNRQSQLHQLHTQFRHSNEKLAKAVHKSRALQNLLEEKDERIRNQGLALESTTNDLEYYQMQNTQLKDELDELATVNGQLCADKAALEQQVMDQFYDHARHMHDSKREQDSLERVVQYLKTENVSLTAKHETSIKDLQEENEKLREQLSEQYKATVEERQAHLDSLSHMEADLHASMEANEQLKRQLLEQADEHARWQETFHQQLLDAQCGFETKMAHLQDENASLKRQLAEQQSEYNSQREALLARLSAAQTDHNEVQAKLQRVHNDLELKSANVARLVAEAPEGDCCAEVRGSVAEDLTFVYVESKYQQDMYENRLSTAQSEIASLRDQLQKCVKRYERQSSRLVRAQASMRDATTNHDRLTDRVKALEAQKKVSDDLEHMLAEAIRKHEDQYETLEISFDVLESAYSFLASELVRTEHALKDSLVAQKSLRIRLSSYEPCSQPVSPIEPEEEIGFDTELDTDSEADDRLGEMRASTAMSMSTSSDRSWPATPGMSMSGQTDSILSLRSPLSSPIPISPPLPALYLPSKASSDGCPSAYPPSDPEDVFGTWSILNHDSLDSP